MKPSQKVQDIKQSLEIFNYDGWLLYDFRKTNPLACKILEIPAEKMLTRRFFYWIPRQGEPIKIVHSIEANVLEHLPGKSMTYSSWQELDSHLETILKGFRKIAMEYSPGNAIPYVSKVDAGTVEKIRGFGVEVVSSADLLQKYTSVWTEKQLDMHLEAADVLDTSVNRAWRWIASHLKDGATITEYDVQQFLLEEFEKHGCVSQDPPICAVNAHSADPHYSPSDKRGEIIKKGDFILIDLWCKRKLPQAVYADITRVGVAAPHASEKIEKIFNIIKKARDAAIMFLRNRLSQDLPVMGWEIDQACRDVIIDAGYGKYFTHRTGHSIGEQDHGDGANIDNFETQDLRHLLPGSCFSIEPGIYLPGEFGIRLEHDVYIEGDGKNFRVTGGTQEEIVIL